MLREQADPAAVNSKTPDDSGSTDMADNPHSVKQARVMRVRAVAAVGLLWLFCAHSYAQNVVHATHRGPHEATIDGVLDEPFWQEGEWSTGFTERRPLAGATPPVATRFKVRFDSDALYIAVVSELLPGEQPRALEMSRDSFRIFDDEAITVKIDVRRDRRTTLGFALNPAGQQLDYIAVDNGQIFRRELDSVWESGTHVHDDRWVAEYRIPVAALALPATDGQRIVGFNITRDHNARRATYDWAALPLEFGAFSALHYGELRGLEGMSGGRPLTLIPYVIGGWLNQDESRPPRGSPWTALAGGEARMRIGEDSWAELTVLTDFAQVDLDDPAFNLDRFPLFFAERRPFFLNGIDVFSFGVAEQAQPFFTRRIGLDANRDPIPLLGGLKLYGRVRTGESQSISYGLLDVVSGGDLYGNSPLTNDAVARLRYNLGEGSYVGVLSTVRTLRGQRSDVSAGADFSARAGRLQIDGFVAGTFNEPSDDEDSRDVARGAAARVAMRWRGQAFRPSASVLWVGEEFRPAVGFVRRRDVLRSDATLYYQHRTPRYGLEAVDLYVRGRQELDGDGRGNLGRSADAEIGLGWVKGAYLYTRAGYINDVVREPFELGGRTIAAGSYDGVRVLAGIRRSSNRNPAFSLDYQGQSGFFGGIRQQLDGSASLSLTRHLRLAGSGSVSFINLPDQDELRAGSASLSATVAPSTQLQADLAWQVNTLDKSYVTLARLRWRWWPGSDIFFVFRERRSYADASEPIERSVWLKLTYRVDALL